MLSCELNWVKQVLMRGNLTQIVQGIKKSHYKRRILEGIIQTLMYLELLEGRMVKRQTEGFLSEYV